MLMTLVDPLVPAIEVWLSIWNHLPLSIRLLANLTLGLFAIVVVFRTFYNLRGG